MGTMQRDKRLAIDPEKVAKVWRDAADAMNAFSAAFNSLPEDTKAELRKH